VRCSWDIIDDAMPLELEELRARSTLLSAALGDDEALEVNEAILDLDPETRLRPIASGSD